MKKRVVVALGHQALGTNFPEQKKAIHASVKILADMVEEGCQLIITHSNAPQVGMIHTALNEYAKHHETYNAPMAICSSMSQGFIGYDIQNMLRTELMSRGIYRTVSTIITQVVVDPYDEAFYHPIKVIGRYLTAEEAAAEEKKGNYVVEEPGKGFRRIVASPKPLDIVEIDAINALVNAGQIVIAGGGGGIPVLKQGSNLKSASAIIEKDLASGLMAEALNADTLLILTSVEKVSQNLDTDKEEYLDTITTEQAKEYMEANQFAPGSMLPKFEAGISFIEKGEGRRTIITDIAHAKDGYREKTGTIIK